MILLLVFCLELSAKMLKMWVNMSAGTAGGSSWIWSKQWRGLCLCLHLDRKNHPKYNIMCLKKLSVITPYLTLSYHTVHMQSEAIIALWFISVIEMVLKPNQWKLKTDSLRCDYKLSNCGTSRDVISKRVPPLILNQNITLLDWCLSKREAKKERVTGLSGPLFTWALQARFPQMWIWVLCKQDLSEAAVHLPI